MSSKAKAKSKSKSKPKPSSADVRGAKAVPRKAEQGRALEPAKQLASEPTPSVTRKDVRALQDAVAELSRQTSVLEELTRGLRKQVKRLKKSEPGKRARSAPDAGTIEDGAPKRPLARAIGAIRRGVQSTRDRVRRA